jgi:hypothetical protein
MLETERPPGLEVASENMPNATCTLLLVLFTGIVASTFPSRKPTPLSGPRRPSRTW